MLDADLFFVDTNLQVLHEFSANAEREVRAAKSEARTVVESPSLWAPQENSIGLIQRCWEWMDRAQVSYWDGLILAAAEKAGCAWLLSDDFQPGRKIRLCHRGQSIPPIS